MTPEEQRQLLVAAGQQRQPRKPKDQGKRAEPIR